MSDWRERVKRVRERDAAAATAAKQQREGEAENATLVPRQMELCARLASVIETVMRRCNEELGGESANVSISKESQRVITVVGAVKGNRVAANVAAKGDGTVGVAMFVGPKYSNEEAFALDAKDEKVENWFGDALVRFFES